MLCGKALRYQLYIILYNQHFQNYTTQEVGASSDNFLEA